MDDIITRFIKTISGKRVGSVALYIRDGRSKQNVYSYRPSEDDGLAEAELRDALNEHPTVDWVVARKKDGDYLTSVTLPARSEVGQWDRVARIGAGMLMDPQTPARLSTLLEHVTFGVMRGIERAKAKGLK